MRKWIALWWTTLILFCLVATTCGLLTARDANAGLVILGTPHDDRIAGSAENDVIRTLNGDDVLRGRHGDDLLLAGPGDDTIIPGVGDDRIRCGDGFDVIVISYERAPGEDHWFDCEAFIS